MCGDCGGSDAAAIALPLPRSCRWHLCSPTPRESKPLPCQNLQRRLLLLHLQRLWRQTGLHCRSFVVPRCCERKPRIQRQGQREPARQQQPHPHIHFGVGSPSSRTSACAVGGAATCCCSFSKPLIFAAGSTQCPVPAELQCWLKFGLAGQVASIEPLKMARTVVRMIGHTIVYWT